MPMLFMIAFKPRIQRLAILQDIARRNALRQIVKNIYDIIEREDSLQSIAALSHIEREAFLKKLSKKLKKERGIKDEEVDYTNAASDFFNTKNQSSDIFAQ